MMLGAFTLHPGVIWENETTSSRSLQQISRTVLGNVAIYQSPIDKKEIVLSAKDMGNKARGAFTREVIEFLLNAEYVNSTVVLNYRGVDYNTIVVSNGVQVVPKRETETVEATDLYTGTVTLMEI